MSAPDGPPLDLRRLIAALDRHGVEYLLCGGAAATAYGAERPTEDADCVVRREGANLDRLADAMRALNARLRVARMTDEEAKLLPVHLDGTTLADLSTTTWMTDAGAFDVLAGLEAADGRLVPYEELAQRANVLHGDGFVIHAAGLDDIITAKERADRPRIARRCLSCGRYETTTMAAGQPIPHRESAGRRLRISLRQPLREASSPSAHPIVHPERSPTPSPYPKRCGRSGRPRSLAPGRFRGSGSGPIGSCTTSPGVRCRRDARPVRVRYPLAVTAACADRRRSGARS